MKKLLRILFVLFFIPQIVFAAENPKDINEIKKICPFGISRNFNVMSKYLISCAVNSQKTGLNQQQVREIYKYLADAYYLGDEVQRDLKKAFDNYRICYNMDYDSHCGKKMAEMYSNKQDLRPIFWQTLKKLALIVIATIPFIIFADKIFSLVFGNKWKEAGDYIQILAIWILLSFIVSCFASIPPLFNRQRKALIIEIFYSLIKIFPFVFGAYLFKFGIKEVLLIYAVLTTLFLLYNLYWYYALISETH